MNDDDLAYQETAIKKLLSEMGSNFDNLHFNLENYRDDKESYEAAETIGILQSNFEYYAIRIKLLCITYFEAKGHRRFLELLEQAVEPFYKDAKSLRKGSMDDGDYVTSDLISVYRRYLSIFPVFNDSNEEILKRTGIVYLENLLKSTAVILKELKVIPTKETEVYKNVKIVSQAVFSDATIPSQSFQKIAKCYIPDILIPSLNCAVEYKYADTEQRLIATIDEILIDVKGYDEHSLYKIFYAVFYVKPGIWTRQRFEAVWEEKEFPKNWKGIMVEGE